MGESGPRSCVQASLRSVHLSVSTNQLHHTNQIVLVCHIINILLTELSRSVWENLDLDRVYRPRCVRSVLTTSVKILQYRPPARLIGANYSARNLQQMVSLGLGHVITLKWFQFLQLILILLQ